MPTIREVAHAAGVSVGTASRALSGNGYTAPATKKLVEEAAAQLGYTPVKHAASRGSAHTVAVVLPDVSFPFYASFLKYTEVELANRGYDTVVCSTLGVQGRVEKVLEKLEHGELAGLILNADVTKEQVARMEKLPTVSFERLLGTKIPMVASNHKAGGRMAGRLLLEAGCQNALLLTTNHANRLYGDYRIDECGHLLQAGGVRVTVAEYNASFLSYRYCREVVAEYMTMYSQCDGIFTDDVSAYCCLSEAQRHGIAVPDKLKILGYDGNEIIQIARPKITTIAQNVPALARACTELLQARVAGQPTEKETLIPVTLQKGETL